MRKKRLVRKFDDIFWKLLAQVGAILYLAVASFIRPTLVVCMLVNELMSELLTATINPAIATGRLEDLREEREGSQDRNSD